MEVNGLVDNIIPNRHNKEKLGYICEELKKQLEVSKDIDGFIKNLIDTNNELRSEIEMLKVEVHNSYNRGYKMGVKTKKK